MRVLIPTTQVPNEDKEVWRLSHIHTGHNVRSSCKGKSYLGLVPTTSSQKEEWKDLSLGLPKETQPLPTPWAQSFGLQTGREDMFCGFKPIRLGAGTQQLQNTTFFFYTVGQPVLTVERALVCLTMSPYVCSSASMHRFTNQQRLTPVIENALACLVCLFV